MDYRRGRDGARAEVAEEDYIQLHRLTQRPQNMAEEDTYRRAYDVTMTYPVSGFH